MSVIGKIVFDIYSKCSERRAERRAVAAAFAGEIGGYLVALSPDVAAPRYRALAVLDRAARVKKFAAFPRFRLAIPLTTSSRTRLACYRLI